MVHKASTKSNYSIFIPTDLTPFTPTWEVVMASSTPTRTYDQLIRGSEQNVQATPNLHTVGLPVAGCSGIHQGTQKFSCCEMASADLDNFLYAP